jgi:hypothetical protein
VVGPPAAIPLLIDGAVSLIRAQQILRQRRRARRRAGRQRRILVLGQERLAEVDRIDVDRLVGVPAVLADILDVK